MPEVLRVVIADDHELVRAGFRIILQAEDDIDVVGQAADGATAVAMVAELQPDVVLMDVQMPVMDGLEATRLILAGQIRNGHPAAGTGTSETGSETGSAFQEPATGAVVAAAHPHSRCGPAVIILTTFDRDDYLFAALRAGASGFLLKNSSPEDLIDAIHVVGRGDALLAPEITRRVIEQFVSVPPRHPDTAPSQANAAKLADLTEREREVLVQVASGDSNAEIAAKLFLGEATIKTHVSRVLMKLGLRDRTQAVVFAYENGVVRAGA